MRTILLLLTISTSAAADWNTRFTRGEELQRAGRYEGAAVEFEASLKDAGREASGDLKAAVTRNNLGVVCRALGRTREAEKNYLLAIRYYEGHAEYESSLATTLENLASLDLLAGRLSKAEALFRRSYEIRVRILPPHDRAVANSLAGLAEVEQELHRSAQAEDHYRQALAIDEEVPGPASASLAPLLHNLGTLLAETGRPGEARVEYERALAIYGASNPDHSDRAIVLRHLAELDASAGRGVQAEAEFRQALEICERSLPPNHPQTGAILQAYGTFLRREGRGKQAAGVLANADRILLQDARQNGSAWVVDAASFGGVR